MQILDHEQEVASTTGKAHAVIPAFTFYRDRTGDEEEKHGKRGKNILKSPSVIGVFICTLERINSFTVLCQSKVQRLLRLVSAQPSVRDVPSSFPWCDLKSKRNNHQIRIRVYS